MREKDIALAMKYLTSSSAQWGSCRIWPITCVIACSDPAIVPLTPSRASRSVHLMPTESQRACNGPRKAAGSAKRAKRYRAATVMGGRLMGVPIQLRDRTSEREGEKVTGRVVDGDSG